jgi:hypothetical protein
MEQSDEDLYPGPLLQSRNVSLHPEMQEIHTKAMENSGK